MFIEKRALYNNIPEEI